MLIDNYNNIRQQIDEVCKNCGRDPEEVTLIAVSKTKPLSDKHRTVFVNIRINVLIIIHPGFHATKFS